MFESHSFLWHYFWVAPSVLLLTLAVIFYRRSFHKKLPFFISYAVFEGGASLSLYVADLMPSVSGRLWWRANLVRVVVEVVLKFAVIGEVFSSVFGPYPSISKLGRNMIRGIGGALVLAAALVAGLAPSTSSDAGPLVRGGRVLELGDFMIECGLLVFIFFFAAYFRLTWDRLVFGIALGRGIAASVQLGSWALLANLPLGSRPRNLLNILNLATFHVCVLLWLYYVLTTPKWTPQDGPREDKDGRPDQDEHDQDEHDKDERQQNLDVWNRELERLLQR